MNPTKDQTTTGPAKADAGKSGDGKERILLAALAEFAARGFDGASTTAIAKRSGVTQPLIHYHFGSKEGLWRATVDELFTRLGREFKTAIQQNPPSQTNARTTFLALIREFVRFCGKYPQFPRLLYLELPVESPRSAWLLDTWVRPVVAQIVAMHGMFSAESGMKDVPVGHLMAALTGAAATPFALGSFMNDAYGIDPTSEAMIERHAEVITSMLENGLFLDRRAVPR